MVPLTNLRSGFDGLLETELCQQRRKACSRACLLTYSKYLCSLTVVLLHRDWISFQQQLKFLSHGILRFQPNLANDGHYTRSFYECFTCNIKNSLAFYFSGGFSIRVSPTLKSNLNEAMLVSYSACNIQSKSGEASKENIPNCAFLFLLLWTFTRAVR